MVISKKARGIQPSATLAISAKAKQMESQGIDVVGFGAGEPDFDTPENIKKMGIEAISGGDTKYTPVSGTNELKKAIAAKFKKDNNLEYEISQISVGCGAKHSIYNILIVLCDPGDEVLIPAPYWVSYPEQVKLADGVPVFIRTDDSTSFKINAELLRNSITPKTKVLILNSPSNPTGMIYTKEELIELAQVIKEHKLIVISDEIYEKLTYDGNKYVSIASLDEEIKALTVVVNGVSKSYAMTGWRIGYIAGPKEIITAVNNLQSHSTSNPTSISQKASVEAITGPQEAVEVMRKAFDERRKYVVAELNRIPGVSCLMPEGAFYVFPNISGLFGKFYNGKIISNSMDFSALLLEEAHVAVVPGIEFGNDNCVRLSYATSMLSIKKGIERISDFVKTLS
ncbi:MAG TPA: aspartate aminotransferase [Candidatus Margulisbacteria bacterium]|nr:MAG: aspartate aminotransferase [Candidatus Margulisbacteria bacterium GWD2_39_127]OGI07541.1 MAG: aspartate aminotransferase [Candidatus Margulisbacteria bacterium GWE2_39_32]HAR64024.1 aspartate aminotransferase [Candidatus Margulisiibacteriota bacterium]HCT85492.1 aspartate aminotransferase [Candidatus Margulisiibacteriota bacterium]